MEVDKGPSLEDGRFESLAVHFHWKEGKERKGFTNRHLAVGDMVQSQWYHFGIGEFTTHLRTCFSGWIGMNKLGVRFGFSRT